MASESDEHDNLIGDGHTQLDLTVASATVAQFVGLDVCLNKTTNINMGPNASSDSLGSNDRHLYNIRNGDVCPLEDATTESRPRSGLSNEVLDTKLRRPSDDTSHEYNRPICESDLDSLNVELNQSVQEKVSTGALTDKLTFYNGSEVLTETSSEKQLLLDTNVTLPLNEQRMDRKSSDSPDVPSSSVEDIHTHPEYKTVVQELMNSKEKMTVLVEELNQLKQENEQVKVDIRSSQEAYKVQLEALDKKISQQQSDMLKITELNQQQAEIASRNYSHLEHQLERMTKMYDSANKDREVSVMRYAVSEKEVIDLKKERETSEKRMKEAVKEKDALVGKLKTLTGDKERVGQMLDVKCHELTKVQKENEKLKEDLSSREIKIKWTQNKLCTELEVHKDTQAKLEKLMKKVQDTKEESEQVRRDCQAMMKAFQTSEENKAFVLEQQLKEQQASLIMERHGRQDKEESLRQLLQEVDTLKGKHLVIINENNTLSIKVQNLEKERLEYEQNLSRLKRTTDEQKQEIVDLRSQLAEMESIRIQLQHEQEKLSASHTEVERLRLNNAELQQDMAACREREAELLDFTQKLTDKNVRLQSEFSATEAKAEQLECELGPQLKHISELEARVTSLSQQLDQERQHRLEENQLLARHLAEKTQRADSLAQQLEDQVGENQVLKRKQAATAKELTRELAQVRKRLELSETLSGSNSLGHSSRASSSTSLNTVESQTNAGTTTKQGVALTDITPNGCDHSIATLEPDRQLLIERIVKLQRASARKTEKLEFMEEHSRQLVAELQKKSKVVQNYIMREQAGALSSDTMDRNKAEVARHGGIMASVYGSKAVDDSMTLELSLEINRKLQAVLEDTLLKNITLKESIDTLGAEISRLQQKSAERT